MFRVLHIAAWAGVTLVCAVLLTISYTVSPLWTVPNAVRSARVTRMEADIRYGTLMVEADFQAAAATPRFTPTPTTKLVGTMGSVPPGQGQAVAPVLPTIPFGTQPPFYSPGWSVRRWSFGGLLVMNSGNAALEEWYVSIPLWRALAVSLIGLLLAAFFHPLRWYRRRRKGLCVHCGYDLTGNVIGRCPECGRRSRWSRSPDPVL